MNSVGVTVTEITEQKRTEEALASLNRALTNEISERGRMNNKCSGSPT